MIYLHKSVFQSHGYLSSANCHVDSRWVLKVSGFALHAFRNTDSSAQVGSFSLVLLLLTTGVVLGRHSPSSEQRQLPIWPPLISL